MLEQLSWKRLAWELAGFYFPWLLIGWFFGGMAWFLTIATVILLLWHYHNLLKLSRWLWQERRLTPPAAGGSWEPIFNGIYRLQQRNRRRRRELGNLIRRFRNGGESLPDAVVVFHGDGTIVWCNKLRVSFWVFNGQRMQASISPISFATPNLSNTSVASALVSRWSCHHRSIKTAF